MKKYALAILLISAGVLTAQEIHLKSRSIRSGSSANSGGNHQIVQFDHAPSDEDVASLVADGVQVVAALPDNAVVVSVANPRLLRRTGVTFIGDLDVADKLSPQLSAEGSNTAIIEFHPDVPTDVQSRLVNSLGIVSARPPVLAAMHAIVTASLDDLKQLATNDEVAYIFPADPDLPNDASFLPCAGMLTSAGPVAQYANLVHGWDLDSDHALHLGYAFGSITPKVPAATVRSEIVRALNEWAKHSNVIFEPAASGALPRTILIKFASGEHGDPYPFDGRGGMLAHTYYPVPVNGEPIAGDMHLDADENWHSGSDLDIYSVALHEAGHALGLGHSDKPGDVMYPYYRSRMSLSANDIGALQALYGVPAGNEPDPLSNPPASASESLRLTLDPVPSSTTLNRVSVTGVLLGGSAPYSLQWQTDRGYSGAVPVSQSAWIASNIPLAAGSNTITFTAFDSAFRIASQTAATTLVAESTSGPALPLRIAITSPSSGVVTVNAPSLTVTGTASGGNGIARVAWQTTSGATGTAMGTTQWTAAGIPLLTGTNSIVVRAYGLNGATVWSAIIAVRH